MCKVVAEGIRAQTMIDEARVVGIDIGLLDMSDDDSCELGQSHSRASDLMSGLEVDLDNLNITDDIRAVDSSHDPNDQMDWWQAWDDNTDKELDAREVHKARITDEIHGQRWLSMMWDWKCPLSPQRLIQ